MSLVLALFDAGLVVLADLNAHFLCHPAGCNDKCISGFDCWSIKYPMSAGASNLIDLLIMHGIMRATVEPVANHNASIFMMHRAAPDAMHYEKDAHVWKETHLGIGILSVRESSR